MSVQCLGILIPLLLFFRAKLANISKSRRSVGPSVTSQSTISRISGSRDGKSEDDEAFKQNRLLPCLQEKKKREIICFDGSGDKLY